MNFGAGPPQAAQPRLLIAASLLGALLLSVYPIPAWMQWLWPPWVGLALLYWGFHQPGAVGISSAWLAGLALDILTGGPWGRWALSLALIMRLQLALRKRLFLAGAPGPQTPLILLLLLALGLCAEAVNLLFGLPSEFFFGLPALIGALLWAPLHSLRRRPRFASA